MSPPPLRQQILGECTGTSLERHHLAQRLGIRLDDAEFSVAIRELERRGDIVRIYGKGKKSCFLTVTYDIS